MFCFNFAAFFMQFKFFAFSQMKNCDFVTDMHIDQSHCA